MTTPVTPPWRQPPKSPLSSKVGAPGSAASIRVRLVVELSQPDPDRARADGAPGDGVSLARTRSTVRPRQSQRRPPSPAPPVGPLRAAALGSGPHGRPAAG